MNRMSGEAAVLDRSRKRWRGWVMSPEVRALTEASRWGDPALPGEGKNTGGAWETGHVIIN